MTFSFSYPQRLSTLLRRRGVYDAFVMRSRTSSCRSESRKPCRCRCVCVCVGSMQVMGMWFDLQVEAERKKRANILDSEGE